MLAFLVLYWTWYIGSAVGAPLESCDIEERTGVVLDVSLSRDSVVMATYSDIDLVDCYTECCNLIEGGCNAASYVLYRGSSICMILNCQHWEQCIWTTNPTASTGILATTHTDYQMPANLPIKTDLLPDILPNLNTAETNARSVTAINNEELQSVDPYDLFNLLDHVTEPDSDLDITTNSTANISASEYQNYFDVYNDTATSVTENQTEYTTRDNNRSWLQSTEITESLQNSTLDYQEREETILTTPVWNTTEYHVVNETLAIENQTDGFTLDNPSSTTQRSPTTDHSQNSWSQSTGSVMPTSRYNDADWLSSSTVREEHSYFVLEDYGITPTVILGATTILVVSIAVIVLISRRLFRKIDVIHYAPLNDKIELVDET